MEEVLKQMLTELKTTNNRLGSLERGQSKLEQGQLRLEHGQQRIEKRVNAIFEQTASLSEFRTETLQRLDNINVKFDILASEMGKQKIDIELLKKRPV